jgi:hypothetical protein
MMQDPLVQECRIEASESENYRGRVIVVYVWKDPSGTYRAKGGYRTLDTKEGFRCAEGFSTVDAALKGGLQRGRTKVDEELAAH